MNNDINPESFSTTPVAEAPTETAPVSHRIYKSSDTFLADASDALGYIKNGAANSFAIQKLRPEWSANYVRRIFSNLKEEGLVTRTGQKRGTKYSVIPLDTPVD